MCGIAGGFWRAPPHSCNQRIESALFCMRERGPDHHGYDRYALPRGTVILGHTRLSIIDLSSEAQQPMHSKDGRFAIIFNGEIYNYKELRAELEALGINFQTQSDTEVLLAAWSYWGKDALRRLVGMFAFAVLDKDKATFTLVRDGFGIKPLFYSREEGSILFASDLHALKELKCEKPQLNWQTAYNYLVHSEYDAGEQTFIDGVLHLLPGHLLELDLYNNASGVPQNWWSPSIIERTDLSFNQAAEQVRELFLSNVRIHLRSDVPIGAALSGGIDSSAVVCAMRHLEPDAPINTFSYIASGSSVSEEFWVDHINQYVGAIPHKVVATPAELTSDLDEMIRAQGEPFGSTSIYAQYRVFKLAKDHGITVTMDGQGADEMLAGYIGYPGQRIRSLLDKGKFFEAYEFLEAWSKWPGRTRLGGAKRAVAELTEGPLYNIFRHLNGMQNVPSWINVGPLEDLGIICSYPRVRAHNNESGRRVVAELALSLTQRGLPALLRHGDRNSMHFSVESRVPFLTLDMANLLLSLPESYLISSSGETKSVFRAAMRGIVPDSVLDRRDKIGFATPEKEWLLGISNEVRGWLMEDLHLPFFNQAEVLKIFDQIVLGRHSFSWEVWRWINFSRWYVNFFA